MYGTPVLLDDEVAPAAPPLRRGPVLAAAALGVVAGIAGTLAVVMPWPRTPFEVTPDVFPEHVLGREREDKRAHELGGPLLERINKEFEAQLVSNETSLGFPAASLLYSGTERQNGQLPGMLQLTVGAGRLPLVPWALVDTDGVGPEASLDSDGVLCVSDTWEETTPVPPGSATSYELEPVDGSVVTSEVFVVHMEVHGFVHCLLHDEDRGVSYHLETMTAWDYSPDLPGEFADELRRIAAGQG